MNDWTRKTCREVEDHRADRLPPAWLPAGNGALHKEERTGKGVFQSGPRREAAKALSETIDSARRMVVLSSFLLADAGVEKAILRAAARGVHVYLMFKSRLDEDPERDFDREVVEYHKAMLNRLAGRTLIRCANYHAKVLVADPDDNPSGFLLTANVTSKALERNPEMAVQLSGDEARAAFDLLRWGFWENAEYEFLEAGGDRKVSPLGRAKHPQGRDSGVVATTSRSTTLREAARRIVLGAQRRLVVSSFGWAEDHEIVRLIAEKARSGAEVVALARTRPAAMPALVALRRAGATVLGQRWLHAKAIWNDADEALVMSANLEPLGLDRGFELGVTLSGERAESVGAILDTWAAHAPVRLELTPSLDDIVGRFEAWEDGHLVEKEVTRLAEVKLGEVTAESADRLEAPRPVAREKAAAVRLAHEVTFEWDVVAPRLDPRASQVYKSEPRAGPKGKPKRRTVRQSYKPPVFKEPSGRLVVAVERREDLARARRVADEVGARAIVVRSRR